ncbi:PAS domain-containing protein [Salinibacter ruber]|uniref:PAS domain-containing protein n=1 Tax=Salinibacter ruber TaxID=146919 RepID=UPI002169B8DF|nr:PAS domain-containing protein [Salinibacter ruber]MCS3698659.1 PAS domain S-box-containing protein [Salinibacter ruber]
MDALPSGNLTYLIYLAVFAVAAAGCLAGAWRARRVSLPGVRLGLTSLLLASGLWALCHVGVLLSPGLGLKVAFYEAGLTVGFGTVFAWLWLCSSYSGRALHRRKAVRWAALILFLAVTLAKLTNRWHGLYFSAEMSVGPFPHLAVDHHVIYWLTAGLSYALAAVGFCMLAEPLRRAQVGGGKLAGLFGLTALPLGANAVGYATPYLLGLSHEPIGVAAFALGALALRGRRLEETSRAGREARPSLVLSAGGQVRNYNQAAAELLPALRGETSRGETSPEGIPQEGTPQEGTPRKGTPQEGTSQEEEIAGRHLEEALPRLARALEKEKMNGEITMNGEMTMNGANGEGSGEEGSGEESSGEEGSGQEALGEDALGEDALGKGALNGKMLDEGMPDEETLEVAGAGGEARYYRPVESQAGPGAGRLVVLQDVTERVLRRRERASRLEAISDSMPGLAFEFRAGPGGERSVEFIGEEAESFLGLSSSPEGFYRRFAERVPEGHREEFLQSVEEAVEGRSSWRHEFPFDRPGGERIWLLGSAEPSAESGPGEEEVVFRGTLADITERKRREQELRETRRELRREKRRAESITENVSEGIYRSTEEGIVYANSAFIEMFGYRDLEELREAGPEALYVDPSRREELIEKEHRHGRLRQEEVRYRRKDGTVFVGLLSSQQVEGEEEGKRYFDGAITDITERKEEERRRKQTVQRVTDAIVEVDSEWRFTLVNDQAEEFYEMDEDNLLGKNFWDVFPQVEGTRFEEVYREVMRSREPAAIEEHYSGMGEWFEVQVYPNEDGGLAFYFEVVTERKEREEALREAKGRYQTLIENFPGGGAYLFDENLRYMLAGGERIGVVGGPEEIIGATVYDILPEGLAEEQERHYRRALEGKRGDFEQEHDGRRYRVQTLPVRDEEGTVTSGIVFSQDITERRRRKEKLKQRKEELERKNDLFERAQEIASVGAWEHDVASGELRWTDQVHRIYGHKDPPGLAPPVENAIEAYHPDDRPAIREAFTEAAQEGIPYDIEVRLITEEGEERWVRTRGEPQREDRNREDRNPDREDGDSEREDGNPEGEVARIRGTIQDITERKRRERRLRQSETLFQNAQDALFLIDVESGGADRGEGRREFSIRRVNPAYEAATGFSGEDLYGRPLQDIFGEEAGQEIEERYRRCVQRQKPIEYEEELPVGGEVTYWQTRIAPVMVEGEVDQIVGTTRDVTDRKRREEALRDAQEELRSTKNFYEQILEQTPIDLAVFSPEAEFEYVNSQSVGDPEMQEWILGRTNEEYCREQGTLDPELGRRRDQAIRAAAQKRQLTELEERMETSDGPAHYLRVHSPVTGLEGQVKSVAAFGVEITERKRREKTLHERQEKLESLYEATNHLLQAGGPEDLSARLSSLVRQALGHPATTIRLARGGKLVPAHVPGVVQERMPERPSYDVDGDTPAAEAHRTGETRAFEDLSAEFEAMDRGDIRATAYVPMGRYGLISVGSFEAGGIGPFDLRLLEVLGSYAALVLERLEREEELLTAKEEAEQARQESEEARQEAEKAKEEAETSRREAEEARQEAEEASRLKSALLANMSHEIRTPLTSIIGFAEMLGREAAGLELPEESPLPKYAALIEKGGKRLLETLNGVLNLSKLQAGQMEMEAGPTCLPEQARLAAEELRPEAEEKGIGLKLETGGGPAVLAEADEGGVQIVLRNLLSNAIKYTEEGGVTVRTYREDGDQKDGDQEDGHPQEDSWAVLEVEDTGIGMDPEVAEGLFEPFRQASEGLSREYEGTGIGLAVTREAVDQMGGSIEVETQKGQGTCMTVRLPLAGEAGAA